LLVLDPALDLFADRLRVVLDDGGLGELMAGFFNKLTSSGPDLSVFCVRVSDTVSTAMRTG
jgi:hypothetical protein